MMINILIAHQSSLPHYRIDFFNALFKKNSDWKFKVVYDRAKNNYFFKEKIDKERIQFETFNTKTYIFRKFFSFQNFIWYLKKYDGIVIEDAFNNISYPISFLIAKVLKKKIIIWGHGRDLNISQKNKFLKKKEIIKKYFIKNASAYLAYTTGVKEYLQNEGIVEQKIFVLNNTIDIIKNHTIYLNNKTKRLLYKAELKMSNKKVILYVGRMDRRKKLDFLFATFNKLYLYDKNYMLIIIGDGNKRDLDDFIIEDAKKQIQFLGIITESEILAKYYIISDLYFYPGDVGLGPLTALSFNLPVMVIDSNTHNPEYEYLNIKNSVILNKNISTDEAAASINDYFNNPKIKRLLRQNIWNSIEHLTLNSYVANFDNAIRKIFETTVDPLSRTKSLRI
jgi:glycosyltransferase involved in cell wall biosynthesis